MNFEEAAELIEVIVQSIQRNPSQFQFEVNVIGTQAISRGGGIGLSVHATGGGPGSNTIGFQSTINGSNIRIAQKAADDKIKGEMSNALQNLNGIMIELRSQKPNKGNIIGFLESLKQSWVPNLITSIIANVITKLSFG